MHLDGFSQFLSNISSEPIQVIDDSIALSNYVSIDLSSKNENLNHIDVSSSKVLETYIESYLKMNKAKVAFGGYHEIRDIYERSPYFKQESPEDQRNIHLGVDLWCTENTPVLAVLDAEIHSFQDNTNFADYGPTIILEHEIRSEVFYSLYGHLNRASLENLKVGAKLSQGQVIGHLGDALVNGDYAPHLHFQLIKNLQGNAGDYAGVCNKKDLKFFKDNCPDPNLLLKLK